MASSSEFYAKIEMLEQIARDARAKGYKGVKFQVFINDEVDQFNQNVSVRVAPTKEESEAKIRTPYLGNGRTYYTDGKATAFEYIARDSIHQQPPHQAPDPQSNIARYHSAKGVEEVQRIDDEDLPF